MERNIAANQVVESGLELLEEGLVARTWGNISCRLDNNSFLITPSGMDYTRTTPDDLVEISLEDGEATGKRKPSSEKGVHAAAYEIFAEANFVIHTHQDYASAIGVSGFSKLDITPDEARALGGIAEAKYGLPGTKMLMKAIKKAFAGGAHTVLMKHHGVVIAAKSREEAFCRIKLLEDICRRNCRGVNKSIRPAGNSDAMLSWMKEIFPLVEIVRTEAALTQASRRNPVIAQLDDMAQMIGRKIPVVDLGENPAEEELLVAVSEAFEETNAILMPGLGGIVLGQDEDDTEALGLLLNKSCICALNSTANGDKARLSIVDTALMRNTYVKKYSKQKYEK
ncbi:MAG: class II aldolase/adducin family protein [Mogibacterium sp.]|nr:class II aldolase/adducin family protein [Mogibacterium sp.]